MPASNDRIIHIKKDSTSNEIGTIDLKNMYPGSFGSPGGTGTLYVTGIEDDEYDSCRVDATLESELPSPSSRKYGTQVMLYPSGDIYLRERGPARWELNGRITIG